MKGKRVTVLGIRRSHTIIEGMQNSVRISRVRFYETLELG